MLTRSAKLWAAMQNTFLKKAMDLFHERVVRNVNHRMSCNTMVGAKYRYIVALILTQEIGRGQRGSRPNGSSRQKGNATHSYWVCAAYNQPPRGTTMYGAAQRPVAWHGCASCIVHTRSNQSNKKKMKKTTTTSRLERRIAPFLLETRRGWLVSEAIALSLSLFHGPCRSFWAPEDVHPSEPHNACTPQTTRGDERQSTTTAVFLAMRASLSLFLRAQEIVVGGVVVTDTPEWT